MMNFSDNNNYLKVLCEIIVKKDQDLIDEIKGLSWTAVTNQKALALNLMEIIKKKLSHWDIDIKSFETIISKDNALNTMFYLIETIKSDDCHEVEQLNNIKDILSKDIRTIDKFHDCLEAFPELLQELKEQILLYNTNIERRIHMYKSLKEFACELFGILCAVKKKLNNFHNDNVKQYDEMLMNYMHQLLNLSFVITVYPPRTIKKGTDNKVGTHFKTTINCLIETEKLFSRESIQPYFMTEVDFREYMESGQVKKDCAIKFKMNNVKLNIWELNMLWIPPKRLQKDGRKSEKITNKKAVIMIIFKALANPCFFGHFEVNTCLFSDTVISIVHTNQEVDALMTLFWDDYFRIDRKEFLQHGSFNCRDSVIIKDLIDAVSAYFEKETSRGLTLSNQEFLNRKLFKSSANGIISFNEFIGQSMLDSSLSFGSWIISLIKLLKIPPNCELWKNNLIDGFVTKDVEPLFVNCTPGTFTLRFSEKSAKIGVLLKCPNNAIEAWNPFSLEECRNRNLCERLMEFHELHLLRTALGNIVSKEEGLSGFIANKAPDIGYTERGQLSRILYSDVYAEPLSMFGDDDDTMNIDPFFGQDIDEDFQS